jgi:hypothetical protein
MTAALYYSGKPCKHGHTGPRYKSSHTCVACNAAKVKVRYTSERNRQRHKYPSPTRPCPALCENCGRPPGERALHLDHDHTAGKFRGWLCFACNSGIGKLGDNIAGLRRAIAYLERAA